MVSTATLMALAGELGAELRQFAFLNHFDILADRSFDSPVNGDSFGEQFIEGSKTNSGHDDAVHLAPPQRFEGLAHSVCVMLIPVFDFFHLHCIQIHDDEPGGGPEMAENLAFHPLKMFRWNTDFHDFKLQMLGDLMSAEEVRPLQHMNT